VVVAEDADFSMVVGILSGRRLGVTMRRIGALQLIQIYSIRHLLFLPRSWSCLLRNLISLAHELALVLEIIQFTIGSIKYCRICLELPYFRI
jgi:hypothetical protein